MKEFVPDLTYAEYINAWESYFEDATEGDWAYWQGNRRTEITITRLSETQFTEHMAALKVASSKFNVALQASDDAGMQAALAESFPHELVLLL